MIEWFGLEGTLKIIKVHLPWHWQGHLSLDQVAQSSFQPVLEHFKGWGIHSFSGNLLQCLTENNSKKIIKENNFLLISYLNLLSFILNPFPTALSLHALVKVHFCLSCRFSLGTGRPQFGHPKAFSVPG